jgi:hypothetical protein
MKKSLSLCLFVSVFVHVQACAHNKTSSNLNKKVHISSGKSAKYHKKTQYSRSEHTYNSQQETQKMFSESYHRYPRKYSKVEPLRIEHDDFR